MTTKDEYKKILNEMFDGIRNVVCWSCGGLIYVRFDKRYNGYIGFCPNCDSVWRES